MIIDYICEWCKNRNKLWLPENAIKKDKYGIVFHKRTEAKCPTCNTIEDFERLWESVYESESREDFERREYARLKDIYE